MVHRSSDEHLNFARFGPLSSFYLKLINGSIGINVAKSKLKEFNNKIDSIKRKNAKKQLYKTNKKDVSENTEALYNGLNIIVDAFQNQIFESKHCPEIDVDIDTTLDSNTYESHGLTKKELQMFKKRFNYKNSEELRQTLIETTGEKYNETLYNGLNIIVDAFEN